MGKYVNETSNGTVLPAKRKADLLIEDGAT